MNLSTTYSNHVIKFQSERVRGKETLSWMSCVVCFIFRYVQHFMIDKYESNMPGKGSFKKSFSSPTLSEVVHYTHEIKHGKFSYINKYPVNE